MDGEALEGGAPTPAAHPPLQVAALMEAAGAAAVTIHGRTMEQRCAARGGPAASASTASAAGAGARAAHCETLEALQSLAPGHLLSLP